MRLPAPLFTAPMNAFEQARTVEQLAKDEILPWLNLKCESVEDTDGNLWLQKIVGDFVVVQEGRKYGVELKGEKKFTGNVYLETWSNRPEFTFGWLWTSRAKYLMYYFADKRTLYVFDFPALQRWAVEGAVYQYPEKPQSKYDQLNYTYGRVVPIAEIQRAGVPVKKLTVEDRRG